MGKSVASTVVQISFRAGIAPKDLSRLEDILTDVLEALVHADAKHPPMDGIDEGFGTLECEVVELHRELRRRNPSDADTRKENLQASAMTLKMLRDCYDEEGKVVR
jgi:hypothetical protein